MLGANFAAIVIPIFMWLFLRSTSTLDKNAKRLFYIALALIVVELVSTNLELYYAERNQTLSMWRVFWSAIGYTVRPILIYMMLGLTLHKNRKGRAYHLAAIPLAFNAVLAFSGFFTRIAYYYTPDNQFQSGPLREGFYMILFFYLMLVVIVLLLQRKESTKLRQIVGYACLVLGMAAMYMEKKWEVPGAVRTAISLIFVFYFMYYQSHEYVKEHKETTYRAQHDSLTGIYNRYGYDVITEKFTTSDKALAFVILDVDHFKKINDTYGHEIGDEVLKQVAELLRSTFRSADYVFRLGGDEFIVLMPGMKPEMEDLISRRVETINNKLQHPNLPIPPVSLSAGASFSDSGFSEKLYKEADKALYQIKETTRCGIAFSE